MSLLDTIHNPCALKSLNKQQLLTLADELRNFLLEQLNISGGHLSANLGTVELTLALHYVFSSPDDAIVWDVGHQAYVHKILTGRKNNFSTLRQKDGIAPFPHRAESPHDAFGVGHSSTAISAALGMAMAAHHKQQPRKTIAIIGDGGLTAGMAFEALNHLGDSCHDVLVILNDNEMSISNNVGALHKLQRSVTNVLSSSTYKRLRNEGKRVLEKLPKKLGDVAKLTETQVKNLITTSTLFDSLNINYTGPIDGHDISTLIQELQYQQSQTGPRLLHVRTQKGHGYLPAEQDPIAFHGVQPGFYNTANSSQPSAVPNKKTVNSAQKTSYSDIFGQWLIDAANQRNDIIAITPAMGKGSGMCSFAKQFPKQYVDVGIAEQHAITLAGGLACSGMRPIVAIYSTFLQRGYDQLIHDIALQNLPVVFAIDRAGLVGADGATHMGSFDISFLMPIPHMTIMCPSSQQMCRDMLWTAITQPGPCAIRYPKGGISQPIRSEANQLTIGRGEIINKRSNIAILNFGTLLEQTTVVANELQATLVDMRFAKPFDKELINSLLADHQLFITVEEGSSLSGVGSAVAQHLGSQPTYCKIINLGFPDFFIEHGSNATLQADINLHAHGILQTIVQHANYQAIKQQKEPAL